MPSYKLDQLDRDIVGHLADMELWSVKSICRELDLDHKTVAHHRARVRFNMHTRGRDHTHNMYVNNPPSPPQETPTWPPPSAFSSSSRP